MSIVPCGWCGSIKEFLSLTLDIWLDGMISHHKRCMQMLPAESQKTAWEDCYTVLQKSFTSLLEKRPEASDWFVIFEYELPRERGRRPDVLLLSGDTILVMEFKRLHVALRAHIDQIDAYARDLHHYHRASHDKQVLAILVLTQAPEMLEQDNNVWIVSSRTLAISIDNLIQPIKPSSSENNLITKKDDLMKWLESDYEPLPFLVQAARLIFQNEPLPQIRRALSAGIPETLKQLSTIAIDAQKKGGMHLALVTGVPGSGKTLVGLQFVYENQLDVNNRHQRSAVLLSGNGPLVKVLQHALRSRVFVQDVHGFLRQYGGINHRIPEENIWVYDEAQRAWDAKRVQEKRGHNTSEPEDFLRIGERKGDWALMIGLIGEGQEIHLGEEAGLIQWNGAIRAMKKPWIVHCPNKIKTVFDEAAVVYCSEALDLTLSLRSHLAEDLHQWIQQLLSGEIEDAAEMAKKVQLQGFDMYITHDLQVARDYVLERYDGQIDKRYGLLSSSKAKNLSRHGVRNEYQFTRNFREGPWYNDAPKSSSSCCQLIEVATEFACQGLELDFPVICWGDDLWWEDGEWQTPPQRRSKAQDPHQLRLNSYRVLLSRGRDGFIVFMPPEDNMRNTYQVLKMAGLIEC